jgi:hypothetical protein
MLEFSNYECTKLLLEGREGDEMSSMPRGQLSPNIFEENSMNVSYKEKVSVLKVRVNLFFFIDRGKSSKIILVLNEASNHKYFRTIGGISSHILNLDSRCR